MTVERRTFDRPNGQVHLVRNRSSRRGARVVGIGIHSTESQDLHGTRDDLKSIRNWFNNPISDASSHIGIDGDTGTEVWVPDAEKAWTILDLNPITLNIEFIGRAAQPKRDWEEAQIKKGAKWAAFWCRKYNFPARRGVVKKINGQAVITTSGIITHFQLTQAGFGTHTDPGSNFPMRDFLDATQWYKRHGWQN